MTFEWIKLRRRHAIHGEVSSLAAKQVRPRLVKRAACTDFVAKSRTTFTFSIKQPFATWNNLICFDSWVVKRPASLFNSFCGNVTILLPALKYFSAAANFHYQNVT